MEAIMTQRERISNQLMHKETDYVPYAHHCCPHFVEPLAMDVEHRLNDYYGTTQWIKTVDDNNHMQKINLAPPIDLSLRKTDPNEISIYTDAWGSKIKSGRIRKVIEEAIPTPDLSAYKFPDVMDSFPKGWEAYARKDCEQKKDQFKVIGLGASLFEMTWKLRGVENALMDSACEPVFYEELVDGIFQYMMEKVKLLCQLPVDGIMFSDDWGDQRGVILGPKMWRKYFKERYRQLYDVVHQSGKFTLSHCCGNIIDIIPDAIDIGLDCLQSVQPEAMNPYYLKKEFGKDMAFWGGLGSQSIIPFGTPEELRSEIDRLATTMGKGGGFILCPAKPFQSDTPTENAAAVLEGFLNQAGIDILPKTNA